MILTGKKVLISGASQGFGFELAASFVKQGADIFICARDQALLLQKQKELQGMASATQKILAAPADISDLKQVEILFQKVADELGGLDVLVANAGVYGPKGALEDVDWDDWSAAIDINLKGVALQCRFAIPLLKQKKYGKIIILSGGGATKPMPFLSAYAASKAAVVRLAETLAEELQDFNIDVNTVAPGALNTRLLDEVLLAGPEKVGQHFYDQALKQKENGGASFEAGTALCAYLASSQSDGITGRLISAIWDPWQSLHQKKAALSNSDIFTLRRITPEDRDQAWNKS